MNERSLPDRTLTAEVVADAVKQYAGLARFSLSLSAGHSLRAGFLTSATRAGADVFRMMEVSRHKKLERVRTYIHRTGVLKTQAGQDRDWDRGWD